MKKSIHLRREGPSSIWLIRRKREGYCSAEKRLEGGEGEMRKRTFPQGKRSAYVHAETRGKKYSSSMGTPQL